MTTRELIIQKADELIGKKGYNAFSFVDIADAVGIKKPSIHHHFPYKTDLGVAVIEGHLKNLERVRVEFSGKTAIEKLDRFFAIYSEIKRENKVCIVGSLSTDYHTLDATIQNELKLFSEAMLDWVSGFLEEGRSKGIFHFNETSRTKAILIISNMVAIVQISRLTGDKDFDGIKKAIRKALLNH